MTKQRETGQVKQDITGRWSETPDGNFYKHKIHRSKESNDNKRPYNKSQIKKQITS